MQRIAFTGPILLKPSSLPIVNNILDALPPPSDDIQIITGGCIGLDEHVAHRLHARGYSVHTVIPADLSRVDPVWLHHCTTYEHTALTSAPYRTRNTRMVGMCDRLIAFLYHIGRNGETMTYNIARKAGKPVQVVQL